MNDTCTCGRIAVGMTITETRNWNPDCPDHGKASTWWNSEEQVRLREQRRQNLIALWSKVKEARGTDRGEG